MSKPDLEIFHKRADAAEQEIINLKEQIEFLRQSITNSANNTLEVSDVSKEEYLRLQEENIKLKHRVAILKRTIEAQRFQERQTDVMSSITESDIEASKMNNVISICNTLHKIFQKAINIAYPDLPDPAVVIVSNNASTQFGDYQCNSSMHFTQLLASQGIKTSPQQVAKNIVSKMEESPLIDRLEVAGPGFINIYLKRDFAQCVLTNLLQTCEVRAPYVEKQRVIVDFSSPNIAKEMHVGHLRSTIIGDSISRILEYLGHDVLRLNHLGDWGTPFGMLIAHLQDKFPDYLNVSPSISDLQSFYKESKKRFDEDQEFKKRAYDCVVKLQSFDPDIIKAWQMICDVSRKDFEKLYARLDINIIERGESFYKKHMESLIKELESRNLLEEDNNMKIMWGNGKNGIPLIIVKSDGGFTYDTSDLAALKQRVEEEKADWLIYVTDAGQALHFQTIECCARRAGFLKNHHKMNHVQFGLVLGEDKKKFKTRSGTTIKLSELLDEGMKKALQKLKEKERDKVLSEAELKAAQECVAYGCIKYADLSHNRNHDYVFSFDKMLEDKGNTAVYLLYALSRIRSIARTANVTQEELRKHAQNTPVSLQHEKEWKLAKLLLKFPDVVLKISTDLYLHPLCEYCYEIATTFTGFYDSCFCVEKNNVGDIIKVNIGRLLLAEATALILEKCLTLLGLKPVSRM